MKLQLLKPLHGWRELIGEVGIIVVGVLLALAAQEVVQFLHWRNEVAEARQSLNVQLASSMLASEERIIKSDCIIRKLDRLDAAIERDLPQIYHVELDGLRTWSTSAWDAAIASGAVANMRPEERNNYANLIAFSVSMRELNLREFETSTELKSLNRHRSLTDVSRDRLAQQISRLRGLNSMQTLGATQWLKMAKALNVRLTDDQRKSLTRPYACVMPDTPAKG